MTPQGAGSIGGTFARHLIAAPLLGLVALWTTHDVAIAAGAGACFAAVATLLACWLADQVRRAIAHGVPLPDSANTLVELSRGAAFGVAVVVVERLS